MRKKWHKITSVLLCMAMLCSNLNLSVSAENIEATEIVEQENLDVNAAGQEQDAEPEIVPESQPEAVSETPDAEITASDGTQPDGGSDEGAVQPDSIQIDTIEVTALEETESESEGESEDVPHDEPRAKDSTPPVISVGAECISPSVTVTDAGGNLASISVWKEDSEDSRQSIAVDDGSSVTFNVPENITGYAKIEAVDHSGNVSDVRKYINHTIASIRRTDLPATCTQPMRRATIYICKVCGQEYGHIVSILYTGTYPDFTEREPAKGHLLSASKQTIELCGSDPVEVSVCERCGEYIDDNGAIYKVPETGSHEWQTQKKLPTCTEPGLIYDVCKTCGAKRNFIHEDADKSLRPTGHVFEDWHLADGETVSCEHPYMEERKCTHEGCEASERRQIKEGSHTWGPLEVIKAPTCTEAGENGYRCQKCGTTRAKDSIPAVGHTVEAAGDCTQETTCSVCGENVQGAPAHNWSTAYKANGTQHWKTCTNKGCTVTSSIEEHNSRPTGQLCTNSWVCDTCGYRVPGKTSHTVEWKSDETYHWQECTVEGCTYKGKSSAHYYGTEKDCTKGQICKTCGYVAQEPKQEHSYTWANSVSMHWRKCVNPGCSVRTYYTGLPDDPDYGEHTYAPFTDCTVGRPCKTCGYMSYTPQLNHNIANAAIIGKAGAQAEGLEDGHYQKCQNSGCRQLQKAVGVQFEHTGGTAACRTLAVCDICHLPYGEFDTQKHGNTIVQGAKEATATEDGYTGDIVCEDCGNTVTEGTKIPKLQDTCSHTYQRMEDAEKCWDQCDQCGHVKDMLYHTLAYESDESGHWQYCVSCKHKNMKLPHNPDPNEEDDDCTTKLTCKDCGYVIVPEKEHVYDENMACGPEGHWHVCKNPDCSQTSTVQPHVAAEDDGNCMTDIVCKDCGYVMVPKSESHQYSGIWESDEQGHYQKCTNSGCTVEKREPHILAEDDSNCTTPVVCSVCTWTEKAGNSAHDFGGAYFTDEDGHWQQCQNEGCTVLSGESEHTGGTAGCSSLAVCVICGEEYGELEPDNHVGDTEIRKYKEPTEEEDGYSGDTYCLGCGEMLEQGTILNKLPGEEHEHTYLPKNDGTHHWQECECGVRDKYEEHSLGGWQSDSTHHWRICSGCRTVEGSGGHTYENGACKVCGFKQEVHEHIYVWMTEGSGHWQQCTVCKETANAGVHVFEWRTSGEAHWQSCTVCGMNTDASEHTLETQSNDYYHWKACTQDGCGYQTVKTAHEVQDDHDCTTEVTCTACNAVVIKAKAEHSWSQTCTFDGQNHWYECISEDCDQKSEAVPHTLVGDKADCTKDIRCSACGYIERKGSESHNFESSPYYGEEGGRTHWQICQNEACEVQNMPEIHEGGTATCISKAVCEKCHLAYGETDPEKHEGSLEVTGEKPATTDAPGYTGDKVCTGCRKIVEYGSEIPQLEEVCVHKDENGESLYVQLKDDEKSWNQCSKCGAVDENSVIKHTYQGYESDAAGHWQVCEICGYATKDSAIGVLPHTAREYDDDCSTAVVCADCGYTMAEAKEHHFAGSYVHSQEGHWQVCQNEGCAFRSETKEHTISEQLRTDCTKAEICEDCGYTVSAAMSGHNYATVWTADADGSSHSQACLNPGCQVKNTEAHLPAEKPDNSCSTPTVCAACGARMAEGKEHSYEENKYLTSATGHWRVCQVCGEAENETPHDGADTATCVSPANCSICGGSYGETNPEHHADPDGTLRGEITPTEFAEGYTGDLVCSACEAVLKKGEKLPKIPSSHKHEFKLHVSDSEYHWLECVCGARDEASVSAHSPMAWKADADEHWSICSGCDKELRGVHTFNTKGQCTVCGRLNHEHRGGKATCKDPAICEICGTPYGSKGTVHTWGEWKTIAEATVFDTGTQQRVCTVCGAKETKTLNVLEPVVDTNASKVPLKEGQSTMKLKVTDLAAGDYVKSWKSSNKKVATVSKNGKIKAKKAGKATITITLASGIKKKVHIVVKKTAVKTTSISVKSKKISLTKGMKYNLKATVKPITSLQKLTYKSSDRKVAAVSRKGVIKARKAGKAKITVMSGSKKVVVHVTVKK